MGESNETTKAALADLEKQAEAAVAAATGEMTAFEIEYLQSKVAECDQIAERHNRLHSEQTAILHGLLEKMAELAQRVSMIEQVLSRGMEPTERCRKRKSASR